MVKENYLKLANSKDVTLNLVGAASAKVDSEYPDIQLFSDGTHQNEEDAYLAAAICFMLFLLKRDPVGLTFNGRIEVDTSAIYSKISLNAAF